MVLNQLICPKVTLNQFIFAFIRLLDPAFSCLFYSVQCDQYHSMELSLLNTKDSYTLWNSLGLV